MARSRIRFVSSFNSGKVAVIAPPRGLLAFFAPGLFSRYFKIFLDSIFTRKRISAAIDPGSSDIAISMCVGVTSGWSRLVAKEIDFAIAFFRCPENFSRNDSGFIFTYV